jgi:hypothetical protein
LRAASRSHPAGRGMRTSADERVGADVGSLKGSREEPRGTPENRHP